jgi:hypothetical protein
MSPQRTAGLGSIALGAGIGAAALLGPLALRVIRFRTSAHLENQFVGGEVVSLGVVAPAAIAAGALWLRDHRLAPALALGPSLYAVYTYTTAVAGQEYTRYDGNVEQFFPLYAGLVAGGAAVAATAWSQLPEGGLTLLSEGLRRALSAVFLGFGGFIALAWTAQIRQVLTGHPSAEYQEGPTLFWLIKLLDLGFVVPALLATGAGLLRRRPAAIRAAFGLTGFATCLTAAVAGMAVAMEINDDPSSSPAMLAVVLPVTGGLAFLTERLLRSYMQGADGQPVTSERRPNRRYGAERA